MVSRKKIEKGGTGRQPKRLRLSRWHAIAA